VDWQVWPHWQTNPGTCWSRTYTPSTTKHLKMQVLVYVLMLQEVLNLNEGKDKHK
jgi:hypothetical protein